MKTGLFLLALLGFFMLGNLAAMDPDDKNIRALFYGYTATAALYIAYHYISRWIRKEPDCDDLRPTPVPLPPKPAAEPPSPRTNPFEKPPAETPPKPAVSGDSKDPFPRAEMDGFAASRVMTSQQRDALATRTIGMIVSTTPQAVRAEITEKARKAAQGDKLLILSFVRGFLFGDVYLRRDMPFAKEWLSHPALRGDKTAAPFHGWIEEAEKNGTVPERAKKPLSYVSDAAAMSLIENLIGLEDVKKQIKTLINRQKLEKLRRENDLPSEPDINLHLVFTGNPGTGKTVVAQRLGAILADAGLLELGHVVEVSGSNLIDRYVGGTTPKIIEAVKNAMGGILFIDEAYALISHIGIHGKASSASADAIATLLLEMNRHKGRFMVIVAGYPEEMEDLLNFNPGFRSRFREKLHFPNFSAEELVQIFLRLTEDRHYTLTEGCRPVLEKVMNAAPGKYAKSFGNARFVGNLFEETLERVANRVAKMQNVSREDLVTITPFDINDAAEDLMRQHRG